MEPGVGVGMGAVEPVKLKTEGVVSGSGTVQFATLIGRALGVKE